MTMGQVARALNILWAVLLFLFGPLQQVASAVIVSGDSLRQELATQSSAQWTLPQTGPPGLKGQTIVFIAEDLRNGGVLGVGVGVREAAAAMGWKVHFVDIGGQDEQRQEAFQRARDLSPDGIILGGVDLQKNLQYIQKIHADGIPMVGWHSAPEVHERGKKLIGRDVTTDPVLVAQTAAQYLLTHAQKAVGVVLFTDSRFAIARQKTAAMAALIERCPQCSLLETVDLPLENVGAAMPEIVERLVHQYGERWQYTLAINDLYFDHAASTLAMLGHAPQDPPYNISAGDGSSSAFFRIRKNIYQKATVAEPLLFQGWQCIDELNRMLQGQATSGFIAPPELITKENIDRQKKLLDFFEPDNGYRENYLRIWRRGGAK
nr:substrate-binding domain-containing protein [uncultured Desulfobulbus sp.]